jgi:hypothetical protein
VHREWSWKRITILVVLGGYPSDTGISNKNPLPGHKSNERQILQRLSFVAVAQLPIADGSIQNIASSSWGGKWDSIPRRPAFDVRLGVAATMNCCCFHKASIRRTGCMPSGCRPVGGTLQSPICSLNIGRPNRINP